MATSSLPDTPLKTMESPSVEARLKYPGEWWKTGRQEERKLKKRVKQSLQDAEIVGISDTDTDGLGCLAVLANAYPTKNIGAIPSGHNATIGPSEAMKWVMQFADSDVPVYFSDIKPNEDSVDEIVELFDEHDGEVYVYDHHEWSDEHLEAFSEVATVDVRSGDAEDGHGLCAANIMFDNHEDRLRRQAPGVRTQMKQLVEVTRDHDVWIKEDERSDALSTLQAELEPFEYVKRVTNIGANVLEDDETRDLIEELNLETNTLIEAAAKKAKWSRIVQTESDEVRVLDENESLKPMETAEEELVVAYTYGSAYTSGLGNVLIDGWADWLGKDPEAYTHDEFAPSVNQQSDVYGPGDADLMVIVKPWGKVSFRSSSEYPICNKVAEAGDGEGGGHEEAAGHDPDVVGKQITYGQNWEQEGQYIHALMQEQIVSLVENGLLDEIERESEEENEEEASSEEEQKVTA